MKKTGYFFLPPSSSLLLQVKVGDTLDLILGEDRETETAVVMRVVLRKASEKNENDKYKVVLRRWKNLKVPKQDVLKWINELHVVIDLLWAITFIV